MFIINLIFLISNRFIFGSLCVVAILLVNNLRAADCGVLKIQKNRSTGVIVINNQCRADNLLSLHSTLQIQGQARLWLESISQDSGNYWVICQNRLSTPIKIRIDSSFLPWIRAGDDNQCDQWVNQRLECRDTSSKSESLLCAIAPILKPTEGKVMLRTTSLPIRGFTRSNVHQASNQDEHSSQILEWKTALEPKINLCRKIFQFYDAFTISWSVNTEGEVSNIKLSEVFDDHQFIGCIKDVIENDNLPNQEKDTYISLTF